MRGRLWLDAATGQVLRSVLTMADRRGPLTATIDVDYGHDAGLGMMVPQVMRERYERRGHVVTTEARYRNYRRFTTSVTDHRRLTGRAMGLVHTPSALCAPAACSGGCFRCQLVAS